MVRHPVSWKNAQDDLTSHFVKLFSYCACPAYFHVTYVMTTEALKVVDQLRIIARDKAPQGFNFVDLYILPFVDSGPSGFTATYQSGKGERQIHFLVLDLSLEMQKNATVQAESYRQSKKKDSAGANGDKDAETT